MLNKAGRQVVDLGAIGPDDLALVGGKALNLGRMLGADLPVPAGFCVPTSAYRWVVGDRLDDLIAELAVPEDRDDLGGVAARIRDRVLATPMPDELAAAIAGHYRSLGDDVPVAVRSSATAEDLPGASFAGQQDTYLNVVGADAVLDATRRCWASLWTERAVSYRTTQGIDHAEVSLAVVVQRMIDAEVAGVMFTANPVTGNRRQLVIDASPGLGESVVSGAVNPDRFVLDATTGATVETTVGDKRSAVLSIAGGGTRTVDLSASAGPCLTHAQLNALTALATSVAAVYESPQDTEWAIDADGRVWLTQARAITTLYPVPGSAAIPGAAHHADRGDRAFLCVSLAQGLTRPITPMGRAAFRLLGTAVSTVAGHPPGDRYRGPSGLVDAGERIFVDITPALRHPRARRVAVRVAGVMEARTKAVLEHLEDDPRFGPDEATTGPAWPLVLRLLARTRAPLRLAHALISPISALHRVDQIEQSVRDRWQIPASATPTERLDAVEERLGTDTFLVMPSVFPYAAAGLMSIAVARRLAPDLDPVLFAEVRRGLPHNVTTEMDLDLWRLASRIGADPDAARSLTTMSAAAAGRAYAQGTLPAVIQDGLGVFLEAYGHRAVAEIDLGMPRWRDDPSHLLGVLANYLQLDDPDLAPERQFFDGARIAESAIDRIVRDTRRSGPAGPLRAAVVRLALDRARNLIGLRERPKSLFVYALAAARAELQLVGAAAVAAGAIADRDDIFFLDLPQARRALDGIDHRDEVRRNRESYAVELKRRHIPRMLLSDGTEPETSIRTDTPDGALIGSPASVGLVTGLARVILDPAGAHLEPGEILVAPSTDPGWTPLFLTAAGLVMEMGGSMSHGAVVAREYGLPAVVGVPDATSRISTGQWITVDGAAGSVVIAESQSVTGAEKVTRPDPDDADAP